MTIGAEIRCDSFIPFLAGCISRRDARLLSQDEEGGGGERERERRATKDVEMMAGKGDDTARVPELRAPELKAQRRERERAAARKITVCPGEKMVIQTSEENAIVDGLR